MIKVAFFNKLMPQYRYGVFHALSAQKGEIECTHFGDTVEQGGIKNIDYKYANLPMEEGGLRWIKTKNYFHISERLLWQTGVVHRILFSSYDCFVFEGGIAHLPVWLYTILCRLRGKKVFYWTHGYKGLDKGFKKIIRDIFFKLPNALLLYGNFSKQVMIDCGFNPEKLFVIGNSLDYNEQKKIRDAVDQDKVQRLKENLFKFPELPTCIFFGRLMKSKQVQLILQALESSKKELPFNILVVGDGPEKKSLQNYIEQNNLNEYVTFVDGTYLESEIATYFAMANLMVSPGNVGLNCIHAMAYGVPVLTHNDLRYQNPEVEAITNGLNGFFYENNNYKSFVDNLVYALKHVKSAQFKKALCYTPIENIYCPEKHAELICQAIIKIYKK
ncbi:MAG: glycosyltransferase [Bacteroidales bacterium]|nr:glycosyltransferase [Bacteroidales bacterium]